VTDVAGVFAALIILGVLGILLHLIIRATKRRIVHWDERRR
jgi:NitT/TauT family transport system permease protein